MFIDTYAAQQLHEQQADREAYYRSIAQRSQGDPRAEFWRTGVVGRLTGVVGRLIARARAHGRVTDSAAAIPGGQVTERFVQDAAVREADQVQSGECVVV